ncbi:MAG: YraN family protein [Pseudohongiellaceae bacterium]
MPSQQLSSPNRVGRVSHGVNRVQFGRRLETMAARFLCKQGCKLLAQNYYCRRGELDLVMLDPQGKVLFVEVRYRKNVGYGSAAESVAFRKQQRLRYAAAHYLRRYPRLAARPCQFDIVAFDLMEGDAEPKLSWMRNAFQ